MVLVLLESLLSSKPCPDLLVAIVVDKLLICRNTYNILCCVYVILCKNVYYGI